MNHKDTQRKLKGSILFKIRLVSIMLISFFAVMYIVSLWDCSRVVWAGLLVYKIYSISKSQRPLPTSLPRQQHLSTQIYCFLSLFYSFGKKSKDKYISTS